MGNINLPHIYCRLMARWGSNSDDVLVLRRNNRNWPQNIVVWDRKSDEKRGVQDNDKNNKKEI